MPPGGAPSGHIGQPLAFSHPLRADLPTVHRGRAGGSVRGEPFQRQPAVEIDVARGNGFEGKTGKDRALQARRSQD